MALVCAWVAIAVPRAAASRSAVMAPLGALGIEEREARKVQGWLMSAARQLPGWRWAPTAHLAKRLREARYFTCASQPACIARLARPLGVELVVTGDVGHLSGAVVVYLRSLRPDGSRVNSVSGVLDPRRSVRPQARELLYQLLLPERYVGALTVISDVDDAWIHLDGRRAARGRTAQLEKIPVGTHAVRVTHQSYRDFLQFVKVGFEERTEVRANLSAFPVQSTAMKLRDRNVSLTTAQLPWYRRWWAVTAFGALVFAGVASVVAALPHPVQRDAAATIDPP